ncbi:MAG: succinate dehydrogenase, cytochrome b556 subunit [Hyphomicrobiales bacterium]|nr:succinate dehydrogenase, cytochrome b556 subunit [Hyphomicrobiales bacterium]
MAQAKSKAARPLSPHLQIFRPWMSMMMSIMHRVTGAAAYFGFALLAWWLTAAASGPEQLDFVNGVFRSALGQAALIGLTWVYVHHAVGGVRHMIWDSGRGFTKPSINLLARASIVSSVLITAAIWAGIFAKAGVI